VEVKYEYQKNQQNPKFDFIEIFSQQI